MKIFRFIIVLAITIGFATALNIKIGPLPPAGLFFSPFDGFWQNAEKSDFPDKKIILPNLKDEVKVFYDSLLIPHIFATDDSDVFKVQGYITAVHRLWQMEFQTHAAAGRLAEILGNDPRIINYDRLQRRIGLKFGAERTLQEMQKDPMTKKLLDAYSEGVNAYISSLSYKDYPIEYKILDYKPENWSPIKTSLLLKYMANNLAGRDHDMENTNTINAIGKELFDQLFPIRDPDVDPIIPVSTQWTFQAKKIDSVELNIPGDQLSQIVDMPDPDNGSNNWAVSGTKTSTGYPILAGDPHLNLSLPSIWLTMQLHTPEMNVMGANLPGALGIIIGFNDSVAWSPTNSRMDVKDWYKIKLKDNKRNEYFYDGQWKKTTKVIEEIKVKGGKSFYDTIIHTHHGPIVYDKNYMTDDEKQNYALQWMAHQPSNEHLAFIKLNYAKNYDDYVEAMKHFDCPAQNFAFASASGDIAIRVQGKFPLKWPRQGQFIMDGSKPDNDWQSYIPFEHNPTVLNPERGFVSSANQIPVDSTYPYFTYDVNYEHYRNRRINQKLTALNNVSVEDMMKLQNDNFNLKASESLPIMISNIDITLLNEKEIKYLNELKNWDYFNHPENKAPTIYKIWWSEFYNLLWDEFKSETRSFRLPSVPNTIYLLNHGIDKKFTDNQNTEKTETLTDLLSETFIKTCKTIDNWRSGKDSYDWGSYKATRINHLIPVFESFGTKNIYTGGGRNIVNATKESHGPSWRMIVELGEKVKAWGVYPGGQSGNPGSRYYSNFIETWSKGEYYSLFFMKSTEDKDERIVSTLTFNKN